MRLIQRSRFAGVLLIVVSFAPAPLYAANYYVSPTGSDSAAGTEAAPFATVGRGQQAATAGDTVFIRGGVYTAAASAAVGVNFNKAGAQDRRIQYFAYPGEVPIFDFTNLLPNARVTGLNVQTSWIHIRGLEVRYVQQIITGDSWGVRIQGSNNILENLNVHHNEAPGVFITSGANNLVLNCDSHHNYDPLESGGNADGFGCHSSGGGNVLSGCRAYANSDDGFDFINATGTCTAEKSISFRNGWRPDTTTAAGNGAGFKSGGYGTDTSTFPASPPRHTVRFCVAFGNRAPGIYANHHPGPGGIDFLNNTAFGNGFNYDMMGDFGTTMHRLRNNVAMGSGGTIRNLNGGTDTNNSWSISGITVSAADFMSTAESEAILPRLPDGNFASATFARLVAGSDLIDRGENVSFPFTGTAPDLGAFEFGQVTTTTGAGGAVGSGAGGAGGSGAGGSGAGGRGGAGGAVASGAGGSTTGATGGTSGAGTGGAIASGAGGTTTTTGAGGGAGGGATSGAGGVIGGTGGDTPIGGCACRVTAGRGETLGLFALALLSIVVSRRRRRG